MVAVYWENVVMDAVEPRVVGRFWEAALGSETLTDTPAGYETRLTRLHGAIGFFAIQVGHGLVEQNQIDILASLPKDLQPLSSIFGSNDLIPIALQNSPSNLQHKQLVVHDKDQPSSGQAA